MKQPSLPLAALAALALASSPATAVTIFSDNFDGGSGDLNGTTPDVTTGVNWVAGSLFNADGTTEDLAGSATLAFTPAAGFIYTLDASYVGLGLAATAGNPENDWFAAGFVNGQSTGNTSNDRFITGNVVGAAWMLTRGDSSQDPDTFAWSGTGQTGGGNNGLAGGNVGLEVSTGSAIDLRIVLDTTAGGAVTDWTATWYAKVPADSSYSVVRPTENLLAGTTIGAVGLARSNIGVDGTIDNFSLTSVVPEPSSVALLGLGGLALLRRNRKR